MGLLEGKRLLVTGILNEASLAFAVARVSIEQGAEIVVTGAGRGLSLTQRAARRLPSTPVVLEMDVASEPMIAQVAAELDRQWGSLDGIVHAVGYAPPSCLGSGMLAAGWDDVSMALNVSAYSLKSLAGAFQPLLRKAAGGSIVGLDFDASVAWPAYDWMGVAKAALESLARYLARDLGGDRIRVNLVAAGPVRTMAAKSIPGFEKFEEAWSQRAPLGWDVTDREAVARACVALLSDWFPMTTGEIVHVDGGYHAMGA